jgi:hypothetical protein
MFRLPLVFALLDGKGAFHYRKMFSILREKMGGVFAPETVISDYETGIINAVASEFPNSLHLGCYFHFTQSVYRNIQRLGPCRAYESDHRVKMIGRKLMALGFLPIGLVRLNFERLKNRRRTQRLMVLYPALVDLFQYFESTWLNCPMRPIKMWNVFDREHRLQTTNLCEGFNSQWNAGVARNHPSLWIVIRNSKRQQ